MSKINFFLGGRQLLCKLLPFNIFIFEGGGASVMRLIISASFVDLKIIFFHFLKNI